MDYFVIGERELVLGFNLVGVQGQPVSNRQEALDSFNLHTGQVRDMRASVESERPKVLIVTEDVADMLSAEIQAWQMTGKSPLIVEIPGLNGHIPGRKTLTDSIREAVGINV
ncbi:V-type ATP synthase subunit F [Treponema sp.]|uniref:V-type ATP synthase subunit F n=1 Tax=Treponema sp. TaxID=166 RepID=UPI00298DA31A|nr:V-type ATP synthase subunit F [Treponema sp.]MCQ2241273.1 V-type ATP synthase subunit F [Treponema sp.]